MNAVDLSRSLFDGVLSKPTEIFSLNQINQLEEKRKEKLEQCTSIYWSDSPHWPSVCGVIPKQLLIKLMIKCNVCESVLMCWEKVPKLDASTARAGEILAMHILPTEVTSKRRLLKSRS